MFHGDILNIRYNIIYRISAVFISRKYMWTCIFVCYLCFRLTSVSQIGPIALNSYGRRLWMRFTYNGLADENVG